MFNELNPNVEPKMNGDTDIIAGQVLDETS
jgi:hypothetical protein